MLRQGGRQSVERLGALLGRRSSLAVLHGVEACALDRGISNRAASWPAAFGSWSAARRQFSNSSRRCRSSSASSSGDASDAAAQQAPSTAHITDLPAKVHLLERFSGYTPDSVVRRYTPFMCSPIHHIATRLEFLHSRGKLRRPPRLWEVICPSDEELCSMHNETLEDLAAFKQQFLASQQWHEFCRQRGVTQPQPEAAAGAAGEQAPA